MRQNHFKLIFAYPKAELLQVGGGPQGMLSVCKLKKKYISYYITYQKEII